MKKSLKTILISKRIMLQFILHVIPLVTFSQTVSLNPITLPASGTTSFVVESGQTYTATSGVSITLKPGVHFKSGSNVVLRIDNGVSGPAAPNNPNENTEMNWTLSRSFDASGAVIGETKSFFDDNGKLIQTQTRNIQAGHVLAAQPLYDVGGRQVGTTMSAPINNAAFNYKEDFVRATGNTVFNYRNYSRFTSTAGLPEKSLKPDPVDTTSGLIGSLGYYYSSKNPWERLHDYTNMPYSTSAGAKNGTNVLSVSGGVGQVMKLGGGHEVRQFNAPVHKELDFYNLVRRTYFPVSDIGDTTLNVNGQKMMSVSFDADNRASVVVSIDGRTVMTGRSGNDLMLTGVLALNTSETNYFGIVTNQNITFPSGKLKDYFRSEAESVNVGTRALLPGLYQFSDFSGYNEIIYKLGLSDVTFTFYDQLGRVKATIAPEGVKKLWTSGVGSFATLASVPFVKTFKYDGKGNLTESTDPDAGKSELKYSSDGKLRYSQNALQRSTNKFSYTNYDRYGRNVESGELSPSGAVNFGNLTAAMLDATEEDPSKYPAGTKYDVTVVTYDTASVVPTLANYVQDSYFLSGSAVATKAKYSGAVTPANLVSKTWYNYDGDGNVIWTVKYVAGLGYKTMDYTYDDLGNVVKSIYQKSTAVETMVHYFEYDKNKRLVATYTNTTDNATSKVLHAKYSYYLHGPLKRMELGDKLQGIDYVYSIDGKLKSINNANAAKDPGMDGGNGFAPDVFGLNLEYHPGDYNNKQVGIPNIQKGGSAASYSGLINGISWFSKKPSSTDVAAVMNIYSYDAVGQLAESRWGTPNFAGSAFVSAGESNREHGLTYDSHGNIKSLIRTGTGTTVLGNYTYNYQANTNKLTSVSNYANYTYDALGQLASQVKGSAGMYLDYDVTGKVSKIYSDNTKQTIILSFVYDDDGNRVMKKDHRTGAVTWYSYDGNGTLAAVFEQQGTGAIQLKEQPIYGSDRLGTYYRLGSNYQYTIADHLGNTRVVINRNKTPGGAADIVYYADYYPFGMEVRSGGIENRYGYQGLYAEKDKETGWNNFELRNYDAAIGRWLTTDPYGQYDSPYVGMGNNPVSGFDIDGGWSDGDPPIKKVFTNAYNRLEEVVVNGYKSVNNFYKQNSAQINGVWNAMADVQFSAIPGFSQFEDSFHHFTGHYIVPRFDEAKIDQTSYWIATAGFAILDRSPNGKVNALKKSTKVISHLKKILPSWKKMSVDVEHVLSGHVKGGSRVSPLKTLFPETMSKETVIKTIRDAYKNVHTKLETQGDRMLLRGTASNGLEIEMWINKATKIIETGYPVY
ncbi:RHS repeat domain-containing protein [Sphingobacterium sp. UBA7625]|nr:RHS repeat-associated core domain-containing protein [Sphingobacterium sp. UBA7625]